MGQIIKDKLFSSIPFWVCSGFTILLLVLSFIVPPTGQIDPSVLKGGALLFGFASLAVVSDAIRFGYDATVKHGNTSVTIGNADKVEIGEQGLEEE